MVHNDDTEGKLAKGRIGIEQLLDGCETDAEKTLDDEFVKNPQVFAVKEAALIEYFGDEAESIKDSIKDSPEKLDEIVDGPEQVIDVLDRKDGKAVFLSEVGFNTHYFGETEWYNSLKSIKSDPAITHIITDGTFASFTDVEALNSDMTYWDKTKEECMDATISIDYRHQYKHMLGIYFEDLKNRLYELKKAAPKGAEIILSADSDDLSKTVSAIVNERLLRKKELISAKMAGVSNTIKQAKGNLVDLRKEYTILQNTWDANESLEAALKKTTKKGKRRSARVKRKIKGTDDYLTKPLTPEERLSNSRKRSNITRSMAALEETISRLESRKGTLRDSKDLWRVKKSRPLHQYTQRKIVREKFFEEYEKICADIGVTLAKGPFVTRVANKNMRYSHSEHSTWTPIVTYINKKLAKTLGGKGKVNEEELLLPEDTIKGLRDKKALGIDIEVTSGHFGKAFFKAQKVYDNEADVNFKNRRFDPDTDYDYVYLVMVSPFENAKKLGRFLSGKEPERLGAGKPIGSRRFAAADRHDKGAVSGLTQLTVEDGRVWAGYCDYNIFEQPLDIKGLRLTATADAHLTSPEENPLAIRGAKKYHEKGLKEPIKRFGKQLYTKAHFDIGDIGDSNVFWQDRGVDKRPLEDMIAQNQKELAEFGRECAATGVVDCAELQRLMYRINSDVMGGTSENIRLMKVRVRKYLEDFLIPTLEHSDLKWVQVVSQGNHVHKSLRRLGEKETDFFVEIYKEIVHEVGTQDYFVKDPKQGKRVHVNGRDLALVGYVTDFGKDIHGNDLIDPVDVLIQHDPKNLVNAMKSLGKKKDGAHKRGGADYGFKGHTHICEYIGDKRAPGESRVAITVPTLSQISSIPRFYSNEARTSGALDVIIYGPGHFEIGFLPIGYLQRLGEEDYIGGVEEIVGEFKKKK